MLEQKKYCAVKQMIRGIGVLSDIDLFSNFKCAKSRYGLNLVGRPDNLNALRHQVGLLR